MHAGMHVYSDVVDLSRDAKHAKCNADAFLGLLEMGSASSKLDSEHEARRRRAEDCQNLSLLYSSAPHSTKPVSLSVVAEDAWTVENGVQASDWKAKSDFTAMIDEHANGQADRCGNGRADWRGDRHANRHSVAAIDENAHRASASDSIEAAQGDAGSAGRAEERWYPPQVCECACMCMHDVNTLYFRSFLGKRRWWETAVGHSAM